MHYGCAGWIESLVSGVFLLVTPQLLVGLVITLLSGLGWYHAVKIMELSNVLRRMVERNGHESTLKRVRTACVCTAIFGISLAAGIVNPIKWE